MRKLSLLLVLCFALSMPVFADGDGHTGGRTAEPTPTKIEIVTMEFVTTLFKIFRVVL